MALPQEIKNRASMQSSDFTLNFISKGNEISPRYTLIFIPSLFAIAKTWNNLRVSEQMRWFKKITYICVYVCIYTCICTHIYGRILFSLKIEILSFATVWLNLEGITLSEINQTEKDK